MVHFPLFFFCGVLFFFSTPAFAVNSCVTASCHAAFGKAKFVHGPVADDCIACHEQTSQQHPQGKKDFRLVANGAELCYRCHDNKVAEPRYHEPVKQGRCTYCHDVHGSDNPFQLVAPVNTLCLKCHTSKRALATMENLHPVLNDGCTACHNPHSAKYPELLPEQGVAFCASCHAAVAATAATATHKHGAMAGGCIACHDPHGTGHPRMFVFPEAQFCVGCHDEIGAQVAEADFHHKPVEQGICWGCHNPHGSDNYRLLRGSYPEPFYTGFDEDDYQLCFMCHDNRAFLYERTSELTGFRNGDRNLHYLHVNRATKGRVCKTCHGVHGADQQKLVKSRIPGFGRWEIPISWREGDNGATCTVGCHKPKTYDRVNPYPND